MAITVGCLFSQLVARHKTDTQFEEIPEWQVVYDKTMKCQLVDGQTLGEGGIPVLNSFV